MKEFYVFRVNSEDLSKKKDKKDSRGGRFAHLERSLLRFYLVCYRVFSFLGKDRTSVLKSKSVLTAEEPRKELLDHCDKSCKEA